MGDKIGVGDLAPDFTLPGTDFTPEGHRDYTLSEYRGRPVVLVFYPADNSPVCTVQLTRYSADISQLDVLGAQVLGLSPQSVEVHDGFSEKQGGFTFPLLADVDKEVGRMYGVLGPLGFYRRSVFVVDPEGVIRYAHRSITSLAYQPVDVLAEKVRELQSS